MGVRVELVTLFVVALTCNSARFHRGARLNASKSKADLIPCPALAAMMNAGAFRLDKFGRVAAGNLKKGITKSTKASTLTGVLLGTAAGYAGDDIHQVTKVDDKAKFKTYYVNLLTLKESDQCSSQSSKDNTASGYPCSQTAALNQHGFSTLIRHGQRKQGFTEFIEKPGALMALPGNAGRGLNSLGLAKLLKNIRYRNGDYSGYLSLTPSGGFEGSNMQKLLPKANPLRTRENQVLANQWQEVLAWSMLMAAFSKNYNGMNAIHEDDLRSLIIDGEFPSDYEPKAWGLKEIFWQAASLDGMGAADEFANFARKLVTEVGWKPELVLLAKFGKWVNHLEGK